MGGLFKYSYSAPGGAKKVSRITAKDEENARQRILKDRPDVSIESIEALPQKAAPAPKPAAKPSPTRKAKAQITKPAAPRRGRLDKLLYRQDGKCFFCGKVLAKDNASIEHLLPKSAGGTNEDGNVVACCGTLNRTLADMPLKEKVKMVLEKSGHFVCPAD